MPLMILLHYFINEFQIIALRQLLTFIIYFTRLAVRDHLMPIESYV